jgi:hypothetical protein
MRFGVPILRHAHVTVCPLAPTLEHSSEPKSGPGERAICLVDLQYRCYKMGDTRHCMASLIYPLILEVTANIMCFQISWHFTNPQLLIDPSTSVVSC